MAFVEIKGLSKTFHVGHGKSQVEIDALTEVSFSVEKGEIVAVTGASGCGKTTLLRILMGLETASRGNFFIEGRPVRGCGYDRGMVFQHAELLPWRSALQNVAFGLELKGVPQSEREEDARRFLSLVGLSDAQDRMPHQLSGGMKQRVGIARALAIKPEVLLMDEPFGALDAQTREGLQGELLEIQARTQQTIVLVTHDLDEAVLLADRVVVMQQGRIKEILPVHLPRPRPTLAALRGNSEFGGKRLQLWTLLNEANEHKSKEVA